MTLDFNIASSRPALPRPGGCTLARPGLAGGAASPVRAPAPSINAVIHAETLP